MLKHRFITVLTLGLLLSVGKALVGCEQAVGSILLPVIVLALVLWRRYVVVGVPYYTRTLYPTTPYYTPYRLHPTVPTIVGTVGCSL